MKRSCTLLLLVGALAGLLGAVLGCASSAPYMYPGHKSLTPDTAAQLRVGMSPTEIKELFGAPDQEYEMKFGADVGNEWKGYVWIYFTEVDKRLKHVRRYKKFMLVFYPPGPNMMLNHWVPED